MCLSEHCLGPKTFSSSGDWARHMTSQHGNDWALNIHESPVWRCDRTGSSHEEILHFRTVELWRNHIENDHSFEKATRLDRTEEEAISNSPPVACPLCYMTLPSEGPSRFQTVATKLSNDLDSLSKKKSPAAKTGPKVSFAEDVEAAAYGETEEQSFEHQTSSDDGKPNISRALSSHIAEHLQRLALLTLRLNVDATDDGDQTSFDSHNPAADESISVGATSTIQRLLDEAEEVLGNEMTSEYTDFDHALSMKRRLSDSFIKSAYQRQPGLPGFLPNDAIDSIVTSENIEAYISISGHQILRDRCSDIINFVCGNLEINASKIFAALLLMDQAPLIVDFMEEKICDNDLPLHAGQRVGINFCLCKSAGNTLMPITRFDKWRLVQRTEFLSIQWLVNAPVFERNNNESWDSHSAMRLSDEVILPWIEFEPLDGRYSSPIGFQAVHVRIHDAHHTFQPKVINPVKNN